MGIEELVTCPLCGEQFLFGSAGTHLWICNTAIHEAIEKKLADDDVFLVGDLLRQQILAGTLKEFYLEHALREIES